MYIISLREKEYVDVSRSVDREGLNACIGPCIDIFDFFVSIISNGHIFFIHSSAIPTVSTLLFFGLKDKRESVDRDKVLKCAEANTCAKALAA